MFILTNAAHDPVFWPCCALLCSINSSLWTLVMGALLIIGCGEIFRGWKVVVEHVPYVWFSTKWQHYLLLRKQLWGFFFFQQVIFLQQLDIFLICPFFCKQNIIQHTRPGVVSKCLSAHTHIKQRMSHTMLHLKHVHVKIPFLYAHTHHRITVISCLAHGCHGFKHLCHTDSIFIT